MGDASDLNFENVSPENVKIPVIKDFGNGSLLPKEQFQKKLEKLVGQKAISKRRIWHLVDVSLAEEDLGVIDPILNYSPSVKEAFHIAKKYFETINYSETEKGYVLQK